jgi:O-Antigen ligase
VAAAVVGTLLWLAIVPLRLRALPLIALAGAAAAPVAAWALSKDGFSTPAEPLAVKQSIAGEFGLLVLLMLLVLVVAGVLVNVGLQRGVPPLHVRRRIGIAALVIAAAVPLVAFTSVAFSNGGIGGAIGDRVDELTSESQTTPTDQGAGRLTQASSTRGKYWREAGRVFEDRPWVGLGAGNFQTSRLRHRTDTSVTRHAHGFVPQTLADLGIVGVAISTLLLLAWLVAAARATGLHPRRNGARRDWDADRLALVAATLMVVVFGLQSAIDWTWFVPGPTAMALVAAGFVAGRAPLGQPDPPVVWAVVPSPARLLAAAGVLVAAIVTAWAIWQPEASDRQIRDALRLSDAGQLDQAIAKTEDAADSNPLSSDPLLTRAAIETQAGREGDARHTLEEAVLKFPGEPESWYRLAAFQLGTLDQPSKAGTTVRAAIYLDPKNAQYQSLFLLSRARARELAARPRK